MSIPVKQTVSCPKCGKEIEFTMWQSINNEMSFAMKDIISGKLFEVECKNCGLRTHVNYLFLSKCLYKLKRYAEYLELYKEFHAKFPDSDKLDDK